MLRDGLPFLDPNDISDAKRRELCFSRSRAAEPAMPAIADATKIASFDVSSILPPRNVSTAKAAGTGYCKRACGFRHRASEESPVLTGLRSGVLFDDHEIRPLGFSGTIHSEGPMTIFGEIIWYAILIRASVERSPDGNLWLTVQDADTGAILRPSSGPYTDARQFLDGSPAFFDNAGRSRGTARCCEANRPAQPPTRSRCSIIADKPSVHRSLAWWPTDWTILTTFWQS